VEDLIGGRCKPQADNARGRTVTDKVFSTSKDDLELIHKTAIRILAEIGIRIDHAGVRDRLRDMGCRVEDGRLFIPPELVGATLHSIPDSFKLYGRSTEDCIELGLNQIHCTNTGIFPYLYDFECGNIRPSTLEDVKTTTRLLDAMDNVDLVYVSLVDATDVAPHMVTVSDFAATLANTSKPLVGPGVTNHAEAQTIVAIARAMRNGDRAALEEFPICAPFVCPLSPLHFPEHIVSALMTVAEAGLPVILLPNPVMGLTAPYTVASTVALGHAEVLAMAVIAYTTSPGLPLLNQNSPSVADMRSLASTTGGPETGLIRQTVALLSRHIRIPVCIHASASSARPDFQAAEEKALNTLLLASARPSVLGGLGGLANVTVTSHETILLDNERYGAVRRILAGVQVDADHLALEVVAELVESGTVLGSEHTLRHLYSGEVWRPRLAIRQGLVGGAPVPETSLDRARAEAKKLIDTYQVEPLPDDIHSEIRRVLDNYERVRAAEQVFPRRTPKRSV
jgi:trimethylamine--corrinoid protein Co-methyltransferase